MTNQSNKSYSNALAQIDEIENLNFLEPMSCEEYGRLRESTVKDLTQAMIRPVFRNIEQEIVEKIQQSTVIVGCVAWLTSIPILETLQSKSVQFIVQQEDWLRPDSTEWSLSKQRDLYGKLTGIDNYVAGASNHAMFEIQPIRLSGKPKNNNKSNARMHHKFILFGNKKEDSTVEFDMAWTGSYNFTANATKSLENGMFIKSDEILNAYWIEWRQVLLSSFRIEDKWWDKTYGWTDDSMLRDGS